MDESIHAAQKESVWAFEISCSHALGAYGRWIHGALSLNLQRVASERSCSISCKSIELERMCVDRKY